MGVWGYNLLSPSISLFFFFLVKTEVNRKIDVFESMWKEGKLSYQVKCTMAKLATGKRERCFTVVGVVTHEYSTAYQYE